MDDPPAICPLCGFVADLGTYCAGTYADQHVRTRMVEVKARSGGVWATNGPDTFKVPNRSRIRAWLRLRRVFGPRTR